MMCQVQDDAVGMKISGTRSGGCVFFKPGSCSHNGSTHDKETTGFPASSLLHKASGRWEDVFLTSSEGLECGQAA